MRLVCLCLLTSSDLLLANTTGFDCQRSWHEVINPVLWGEDSFSTSIKFTDMRRCECKCDFSQNQWRNLGANKILNDGMIVLTLDLFGIRIHSFIFFFLSFFLFFLIHDFHSFYGIVVVFGQDIFFSLS